MTRQYHATTYTSRNGYGGTLNHVLQRLNRSGISSAVHPISGRQSEFCHPCEIRSGSDTTATPWGHTAAYAMAESDRCQCLQRETLLFHGADTRTCARRPLTARFPTIPALPTTTSSVQTPPSHAYCTLYQRQTAPVHPLNTSTYFHLLRLPLSSPLLRLPYPVAPTCVTHKQNVSLQSTLTKSQVTQPFSLTQGRTHKFHLKLTPTTQCRLSHFTSSMIRRRCTPSSPCSTASSRTRRADGISTPSLLRSRRPNIRRG